MAEIYKPHEFKADKWNKFRCTECPFLANNGIHRKDTKQALFRGIVRPDKLG